MRGLDRPLLILYVSIAKAWRFRSRIETELSFSDNSLNINSLNDSLYIGTFHEYFPIVFTTMTHPNQRTVIKLS